MRALSAAFRAEPRGRLRTRALVRTPLLALVLALALLTVPESEVAPTHIHLVKVERAHGVDLSPDVIWILALGSDARPGESITRSRADALQLVGIHADTGAATAIGMARDSWVNIPGHGQDRINAAMVRGGPQLQARAVAQLIGIEPDYVMVTGFKGFEGMVREIGAIRVDNPYSTLR